MLTPASTALEGKGPASLWSDKVEAEASVVITSNTAAEDGGKDLRPELDKQPMREVEVEGAAIDLSDDDPLDPTDAQHLQTIRRAAALDRSDPDTLPEF